MKRSTNKRVRFETQKISFSLIIILICRFSYNFYQMKQLTTSKPLCYMLPNSDRITALPYIDQQLPQYKNRVQYLIKNEQQSMAYDSEAYLSQLKVPNLLFANSADFENEVARVLNKIQSSKGKEKIGKVQQQKKQADGINIEKLIRLGKIDEEVKKKIEKLMIRYQNNIVKQVNLELYQKLAPLVQKQYMSALDKKKALLLSEIEKEKQKIEEINKRRQYGQLEAKQRQQTIKDRVKVMIHKKRKLQ